MRSPHTRGDGPRPLNRNRSHNAFSPHAWGWSVIQRRQGATVVVLPTRVGMVRRAELQPPRPQSSPHTRGDGPIMWLSSGVMAPFSPHAWGWSAARMEAYAAYVVLPTRVGMVRKYAR